MKFGFIEELNRLWNLSTEFATSLDSLYLDFMIVCYSHLLFTSTRNLVKPFCVFVCECEFVQLTCVFSLVMKIYRITF